MRNEKIRKIAFLGTSLPRECGLATFTQDIIDELKKMPNFPFPHVIAMNNDKTYAYGNQVAMQIDQQELADYPKAAERINRSNYDLVVIQHEFGIYGGSDGEYVLEFAQKLNVPLITIFHTILPKPRPNQRRIIHTLGRLSAKVVTMATHTLEMLVSVYDIDNRKIEVIHHGVPTAATGTRDELKAAYGFAGRQIISTFGFLSPGKGVEYAVEAMAEVVKSHPEALYIVWGQTHPVVKKERGEDYRRQLESLVGSHRLQEQVKFVNRHLTKEEVIESLVMSDIYMTPYLGKDQAVSGTLAYGIGYGRVVVSTPYNYAVEMLADGRGLLAEFRNGASLAACVNTVLDNPERKRGLEARTAALGRTMRWNQVAMKYAALFDKCAAAYAYKGSVS